MEWIKSLFWNKPESEAAEQKQEQLREGAQKRRKKKKLRTRQISAGEAAPTPEQPPVVPLVPAPVVWTIPAAGSLQRPEIPCMLCTQRFDICVLHPCKCTVLCLTCGTAFVNTPCPSCQANIEQAEAIFEFNDDI